MKLVKCNSKIKHLVKFAGTLKEPKGHLLQVSLNKNKDTHCEEKAAVC